MPVDLAHSLLAKLVLDRVDKSASALIDVERGRSGHPLSLLLRIN